MAKCILVIVGFNPNLLRKGEYHSHCSNNIHVFLLLRHTSFIKDDLSSAKKLFLRISSPKIDAIIYSPQCLWKVEWFFLVYKTFHHFTFIKRVIFFKLPNYSGGDRGQRDAEQHKWCLFAALTLSAAVLVVKRGWFNCFRNKVLVQTHLVPSSLADRLRAAGQWLTDLWPGRYTCIPLLPHQGWWKETLKGQFSQKKSDQPQP